MMTEYTLDKYDFKRYLLKELHDTRQEDLIFWKSRVPMHVDLIYDLFEKRGTLFNLYLHHIGAAYLYAWIMREEGENWPAMLAAQPNMKNDQQFIKEQFGKYAAASGVASLLSELSELFLLENFKADEEALSQALCHQGKKYERLYLPQVVRDRINTRFPELLQHMALKNWDMFSNVVADVLGIYRMGFADAFAGIFNKLIEYVLVNSGNSKKAYSNASAVRITQQKDKEPVLPAITYGLVADGSVWEPVYKNAKTAFVLNKMHPFAGELRKAGPAAEAIVARLLTVMAEKENEIIKPTDKRLIEIFRQDIARELRIQAENDQATS